MMNKSRADLTNDILILHEIRHGLSKYTSPSALPRGKKLNVRVSRVPAAEGRREGKFRRNTPVKKLFSKSKSFSIVMREKEI